MHIEQSTVNIKSNVEVHISLDTLIKESFGRNKNELSIEYVFDYNHTFVEQKEHGAENANSMFAK